MIGPHALIQSKKGGQMGKGNMPNNAPILESEQKSGDMMKSYDGGAAGMVTPAAVALSISQFGDVNFRDQSQAADVVASVRNFKHNSHQNGMSKGSLKIRSHMTRGSGASRDGVGISHLIQDEELKAEVIHINKQISEKGDLILKNQKLQTLPRALFKLRFDNLLSLDVRGNELTEIDENFCLNLTQLRKLDARGNKIKIVSPHIKAIMTLQVLRLDSNILEELPLEIGELIYLEELSFQYNRIKEVPAQLFSKLSDSLLLLNLSDNKIKHLPPEIGTHLKKLQVLHLHGNRFTSFPCSFASLVKNSLQELSLEWFLYAKPPRPRVVKRGSNEGDEIFEQLVVLCELLVKYKMNECALITFLENYSTVT